VLLRVGNAADRAYLERRPEEEEGSQVALIDDSLRGLVHALHRREELVLVEGVEISVVAEALVNALAMRKGLGHLGAFVSNTLLTHPGVDDLYATDRDIVRLLSEL